MWSRIRNLCQVARYYFGVQDWRKERGEEGGGGGGGAEENKEEEEEEIEDEEEDEGEEDEEEDEGEEDEEDEGEEEEEEECVGKWDLPKRGLRGERVREKSRVGWRIENSKPNGPQQ